MSDTLTLRGSEVQLRLNRDKKRLSTLTACKDMEITFMFDVTREGYQGEKTDRRDENYRGVSVSLTYHPESPELLQLAAFVRDRATRRTAQANNHVDLTAILEFPGGQRPRITIADLKFGNIPLSSPGRDQFVTVKLSCEADDFDLAER